MFTLTLFNNQREDTYQESVPSNHLFLRESEKEPDIQGRRSGYTTLNFTTKPHRALTDNVRHSDSFSCERSDILDFFNLNEKLENIFRIRKFLADTDPQKNNPELWIRIREATYL
jgi:hypothetical protein